MSFTQVSTLLEKNDAITYMENLVRSHQHPDKRREALHFLKILVKQDQEKLRASTQEHIGHKSTLKALEEQTSHLRDIDIFANTPLSKLQVQWAVSDGSTGTTLYLDGIDSLVPADEFQLVGTDREFLSYHSGSALLSDLTLSNTFHKITFKSATDIVVKGLKFTSDSTIQDTVTFPSNECSNITFENCIFSSAGHADSRFWNGAHNLVGTVTIKNCWITGFSSWMNFDLSSDGALATKALTSVIIEGCVFYNCKGSAAIRGLESAPMTSCVIRGNKWIWDDSFALHNYFWSAIEVNECVDITIEDNEFLGKPSFKTTGTGYRGAVQCFSRDSKFALTFKNNRVENFNVALQLAFGNVGSPAQFYGLSSYQIDQGTCVGVWNFASLVYPWHGVDGSGTATTWQVLGGDKDPTITNLTLPVVKVAADWATSDPASGQGSSGGNSSPPDVPLIGTFDCTGEVSDDLILDGSSSTVIELGDSASGYVRINNSVLLTQDSIKWFHISVHSNLIENSPGRQWLDQVIAPDGSAYTIVDQTRSFSDGTMVKRCQLGPNSTSADVPAGVGADDFFFKLYFTVMPIP